MKQRQPGFLFAPTPVDEAKGVTIRRVIGGERMAILDPFILLDHASIGADSEVVGFPRHPHRGIETLSYVLAGTVGHKDSNGIEGQVGPGGSQWMTAGDGIWHEEMLIPAAEGAEMLQLWFSLPADRKRVPSAYYGGPAEEIPQLSAPGATVRVVAGSFGEVRGFFEGIAVNPTVLDIQLSAGSAIDVPTEPGAATFAYVVRGLATCAGSTARSPMAVVFTDGDSVSFSASTEGARILFVSAKPLYEPILQYRSFVMNTVEDIQETLALIKAGTFAK